jgi:putative endonuclease
MYKAYYVYILSDQNKKVLYVGVTSDLRRRICEHKQGKSSFTKRYRVNRLVYYERLEEIEAAILREKQIKNLSRAKKNSLIEADNPEWVDLYLNL